MGEESCRWRLRKKNNLVNECEKVPQAGEDMTLALFTQRSRSNGVNKARLSWGSRGGGVI